MSTLHREWLFSLLIASICIVLAAVDISHVPAAPGGLRCRGMITAVDNSLTRVDLIVKTGPQVLTVRLLNGPHKGRELPVVNQLTGKMEIDEFYEAGKVILVEYLERDGKPANAVARGYYRLQLQLVLIILFFVLLVAVAGVTGLKAALSFIFAAMVLWRLFFPLLLRGWSRHRSTSHGGDLFFSWRPDPPRSGHVHRIHAGPAAHLRPCHLVYEDVLDARGRAAIRRDAALLRI